MKKYIFILAVLTITISLISCTKDNNIKPEPSLNGKWDLITVTDKTTGISTNKSASTGIFQITIAVDSTNYGKLHEDITCNEITDSISINKADKSIHIWGGFETCLYCPSYSWSEINTGMGVNTHYYFDAEERLIITSDIKIYIFQRM